MSPLWGPHWPVVSQGWLTAPPESPLEPSQAGFRKGLTGQPRTRCLAKAEETKQQDSSVYHPHSPNLS